MARDNQRGDGSALFRKDVVELGYIGGLIGHYSFLTADWVMKRGAVENRTNMTACIPQTLSIHERKSIAPKIGRLVNNNVIILLRYLLM
jgi:hypothetical protein